jgi:hypothetical protein
LRNLPRWQLETRDRQPETTIMTNATAGQTTNPQEARRQAVAALNDAFRTSLTGGRVVMTTLVAELAPAESLALLSKVQQFDFTAADPGDNPYGTNDFGAIKHGDETFYFKIDYYASGHDYMYASDRPDRSDCTDRVLTIMSAEEY